MTIELDKLHMAPEFRSLSKEAKQYLVGHGAVKLSGVISQQSVERLDRGVPHHPVLLKSAILEMADIFNKLYIPEEKLIDGKTVVVSIQTINPFSKADPMPVSNIDNNNQEGVSLLVPIAGGAAFFGADDERFGGIDEVSPRFLTTYGKGDAVLVRQNIHDQATGQNYSQAHHLGIGIDVRKLMVVDFSIPELRIR